MIRVTLIRPASRRYILAQWDDPITGLTKTRSTRETDRRKAERFAGKLEDELNSGTHAPPMRITWADFCDRYKSEVSAAKSPGTGEKTLATIRAVNELVNPKYLATFAEANVISKFATSLRSTPYRTNDKESFYRSPSTIDAHLREVRKLMIWAKRMRLIKERPHIEFPPLTEAMKGRAVTDAEFARMLSKVPDVVPKDFQADWVFYLRGLWLSGLRLEESLSLDWEDDRQICVDFMHRRPMFRIQGAIDKTGSFRLLPMTPDFAELLSTVPKRDRHGRVFNPWTLPPGPSRKGRHRPTHKHAGRVVSDIARTAGVFVTEKKPASCHDLRRAFGLRCCKKVMPKVLQELMRHDSIQTTMRYYVGQLAEDAADAVWSADW